MSAQHTPGPWTAPGGIYVFTESVDTRYVAQAMHAEGMTEEDVAANARLIAAAPDLLEALQALVAQVERGDFDHIGPDHPSSAVHAARIAIENATATGSQQPPPAIPPEAASIGAVLDGESLEQADAS